MRQSKHSRYMPRKRRHRHRLSMPLSKNTHRAATTAAVLLSLFMATMETTNLCVLHAGMFFLGLGLGFANTPLVLAIQESVTWHQRGVATAPSAFFRSIGGSIAVGALGGILAAGLVGTMDPRVLSDSIGSEHGRHLDPALMAHLTTRLEASLVPIFRIVAAFAGAAFALSFFFPPLRLGQTEAARNHQDALRAGTTAGKNLQEPYLSHRNTHR